MMRRIFYVLLMVTLVGIAGQAQAPNAPMAPAGGGQRGAAVPGGRAGGRGPAVVSPVVNAAEHTFTVRFLAPNAKQVTVIGEIDGQNHPMTKDDNGIWSVTVGPLAPDVYNYQLNVDGIIAMDPQNPSVKLGFGAFPPASLVEIPDTGLAFDDARPVPHGTIRVETYESKAIGAPRTLWIYTPPGYDRGNTRYPVFYLLHGAGNIDSSWILTGRANLIMDNLIAEGRAKPMILVNPLGYARQGIGLGPEKPVAAAAAPAAPGTGGQNSAFMNDLLGDVIPFVEKNFRTLPGADNRALGGLSMGGGQTISIGFTHTDTFHSLIVMSAGSNNADQLYPDFFNAAVTNKKLKLMWIGIGKDDPGLANAKALDAALTSKGITHTFQVGDGRHEWVVWRHHLNEVAPLLFR